MREVYGTHASDSSEFPNLQMGVTCIVRALRTEKFRI